MSDLSNPIQFTSRTFNTILSDINADPLLVDRPAWFKRLIAGMGDVFSLWSNAQANNSYLATAFTRQAVTDLAAMLDYFPAGRAASSGVVLFDLNPAVLFPFNPAVTDLVAVAPGTSQRSQKRFEARATLSVPAFSETFTANPATEELTVARSYTTGESVRVSTTGTLPAPLAAATTYFAIRVSATLIRLATSRANAYANSFINLSSAGAGTHTITLLSFQQTLFQQTTQAQVVVGQSDGVTPFQDFDIPDLNVLEATMAVTINAVLWTRIPRNQSFTTLTASSQSFKVLYKSDGSAFIRFGNGTFGQIPPAGFDIQVVFATGGGADSNISTVGAINTYGAQNASIIAVSNPAATTGGSDEEALSVTKRQAPLLLKSRERFVTTADGEALTIAFGGISQAKVNKNFTGPLTVQVLAIPFGGGNLSPAQQTALDTFLTDRTVLEEVAVTVSNVTFLVQNVTAAAKMLPGFTFATVQPFFNLAWRLFFTETGQEIADRFTDSGISATITLVNAIFGTTFTDADQADLLPLLQGLDPRRIGEDVQQSDAFGYLERVRGVDFLTITAPAFPIVVASDQITQPGTIATSEIP